MYLQEPEAILTVSHVLTKHRHSLAIKKRKP